jgi:alkanesulfonate monooxygenase
MSFEFLWYIPNQVTPGHRGEPVTADHNSLDTLTAQAQALEDHGWKGALLGTGWGRPDTFTIAAALTARTTTFEPLIAVRGAYGDAEGDQADRYARTREFIQLVRKLWTEENVSYAGGYFSVTGSTIVPRIEPRGGRLHPKLYFGGASQAAEKVAATEADVQLFWGEPLDGVRERIERLKTLSTELGREHAPLEFGLRVTTFVRDTTQEAWADAEAKVAAMAKAGAAPQNPHRRAAVGQQRLFDLASRGEVLDDNLYTTPGKFGGGGAGTTWLVGSPQDVAKSLQKYAGLGITHFVLSDTPYLREIRRQGDQLLPLLHSASAPRGLR